MMIVFPKLHRGPNKRDEAQKVPRVSTARQSPFLTQHISDHDRIEDYLTNDADPNIDNKLHKPAPASNAQRERRSWLLIK